MNNTCNKTSNNKYFDCPARMDDGRIFTDYRSTYSVDDMIRYSNNVMGSYDYRQFLIHNGENIMQINKNYTKNKAECNSCDVIEVPFNKVCDINKQYSKCNIVNPDGIGNYNNVINEDNMNKKYPNMNGLKNSIKKRNPIMEESGKPVYENYSGREVVSKTPLNGSINNKMDTVYANMPGFQSPGGFDSRMGSSSFDSRVGSENNSSDSDIKNRMSKSYSNMPMQGFDRPTYGNYSDMNDNSSQESYDNYHPVIHNKSEKDDTKKYSTFYQNVYTQS
jgi:hypothetical protein